MPWIRFDLVLPFNVFTATTFLLLSCGHMPSAIALKTRPNWPSPAPNGRHTDRNSVKCTCSHTHTHTHTHTLACKSIHLTNSFLYYIVLAWSHLKVCLYYTCILQGGGDIPKQYDPPPPQEISKGISTRMHYTWCYEKLQANALDTHLTFVELGPC